MASTEPTTKIPGAYKFIGLAIAGVIVGACIGFILRPAIPLVGEKLPFEHVITRGGNFTGLDQLLVPYAQTSFNHMCIGGAVGILPAILVFAASRKPPSSPTVVA